MAKLTQTFVKQVKLPASGYEMHWDDEIRGFGLRVTCKGVKSFVFNYRASGTRNGKTGFLEWRWTIGRFGKWRVETAREEARRLGVMVDQGQNPFVVERTREQEAIEEAARQKTVNDLGDYYLSHYAEAKKRPSSVAGDKYMLDKFVYPELRDVCASKITRHDISELHASLKAHPYQANRVLALLHKMFGEAIANQWGGITANPSAGIKRYNEEKRDRWLSADELQRLAEAMAGYPDACASKDTVSEKQRAYLRKEAQRGVNAIRLIGMTGCRKSEALTAKWTDFDLQQGVWTKPSHHTKQKKTEHVKLNKRALALLESLPRDGEYLFPGRTGEHLLDVKGVWEKVCETAKLDGVRIHDLRHSFASHLVSSGVDLYTVGKLLGHTQPQTTARYAHLADDAQREAANKFPVSL